MTTSFPEPYAIHFKKEPNSPGAEYLPVAQGRMAGGTRLAWVPAASLTIMMTVRGAPTLGSFLRLFRADNSMKRAIFTVRANTSSYTATVAAEPGDYLRFYTAAVDEGTEVEALVNVVPLPYS